MVFYTPEEVAKMLKVEENTLRIWLREGKIKGCKIGSFWRIKEEDLKEFITSEE